jgi:hypothetical protein
LSLVSSIKGIVSPVGVEMEILNHIDEAINLSRNDAGRRMMIFGAMLFKQSG